MGRSVPERPDLLAEARRLADIHIGETAPLRVTVSKETEERVQRVLLIASRRMVLFDDDLQTVGNR